MLTTFWFGVSSNLSQQKSPTAEIIGIYFPEKIYAYNFHCWVLFLCDKFEETPNEKVVNMTKLTKSYFRKRLNWAFVILSTDLLMSLFICKCYHFSTSNTKCTISTRCYTYAPHSTVDTAYIETCNAEGYRQVLLKSGRFWQRRHSHLGIDEIENIVIHMDAILGKWLTIRPYV